MKKRTAIWKKRRAGLSRKGRILRNLLLSLLLLLPLWWMADCPLGIPALEFHRLERENLVPRGKIFFSAVPLPWEHGVSQVDLDGETFSLQDGVWMVGASRDWAGVMGRDRFYLYPRGEGPDAAPVSLGHLLRFRVQDGKGDSEILVPLLFLDVPEEAVRAELDMVIPYECTSYRRSGTGTRQKSGAWLFGLEPPDNRENGSVWSENWYEGASWTLRTWSADGEALEEYRGTVPGAF